MRLRLLLPVPPRDDVPGCATVSKAWSDRRDIPSVVIPGVLNILMTGWSFPTCNWYSKPPRPEEGSGPGGVTPGEQIDPVGAPVGVSGSTWDGRRDGPIPGIPGGPP
jgi:hypothetical protein